MAEPDDLDQLIAENASARQAERAAADEAQRLASRIVNPEAAARQDREAAELRERLQDLGVAFIEPEAG
jgi:hypothetical protein